MDDDALNMRNWGYYEPAYKGHQHLGLHLMPGVADRDIKPYNIPCRDSNVMIGSANGAFHPRDCLVSDTSSIPMNYMREGGWLSQREKLLNMLPMNSNYPLLPETSRAHAMQIVPIVLPNNNPSRDERGVLKIEEIGAGSEEPDTNKGTPLKKRQNGSALKNPKPKKARKPKENGALRLKPAKKSMDVVINGIDMDISGIPIPVCSCTGSPQQCYRWGCGGWQSACCTTNVSVYPLPMSTKRRGARIAGRKMSQGAFKKVLEKLAAEGFNFTNPIDLRTQWARHGTNKFVTIR